MVEVGLADEDAAERLQSGAEFGIPAAALVIDEMVGDKIPDAAVPLLEAWIAVD